jgi:hypothetical protein
MIVEGRTIKTIEEMLEFCKAAVFAALAGTAPKDEALCMVAACAASWSYSSAILRHGPAASRSLSVAAGREPLGPVSAIASRRS